MAQAIPTSSRNALLSRVAAAVLGGYVLVSSATVFLSYLFPTERAEAVLAATLLSYAVYTGAVIWVFAVKTLRRAWLGLIVPAIAMGVLSLVLDTFGGFNT